MQRLRGAFTATPIERLNVRPFLDLHLARKKARLHRLKAKGLTPAGDKASLRAMADEAARSHHIRKVPARATAEENRTDRSR